MRRSSQRAPTHPRAQLFFEDSETVPAIEIIPDRVICRVCRRDRTRPNEQWEDIVPREEFERIVSKVRCKGSKAGPMGGIGSQFVGIRRNFRSGNRILILSGQARRSAQSQ